MSSNCPFQNHICEVGKMTSILQPAYLSKYWKQFEWFYLRRRFENGVISVARLPVSVSFCEVPSEWSTFYLFRPYVDQKRLNWKPSGQTAKYDLLPVNLRCWCPGSKNLFVLSVCRAKHIVGCHFWHLSPCRGLMKDDGVRAKMHRVNHWWNNLLF